MTFTLLAMDAADATRQIGMLTDDWQKVSEDMVTNIRTALSKRETIYYGYIMIPEKISDDEVIDILTYNVQTDYYYDQWILKYCLDFAWYDISGRHVMFWGENQADVEAAADAMKRALFDLEKKTSNYALFI
jgi:hypothetical protein